MKIAVLTGSLPNYDELAKHTTFVNKREYCERHGYELEVINTVRPKYRDPKSHAAGFSWSRLEHMAEMVECGQYDWVWTVGCDTLVTNMTIKLESIIETAETEKAQTTPLPVCPFFPNSPASQKVINWTVPPNHKTTGKKHLLISAERVTSMQADSFIVRGSREGSDYLRDILSYYSLYKYHVWVENQAMIDLRDKHASITHMVPQWMLNAVDWTRWHKAHPAYRSNSDCFGNRGNWQKGDFIIHWPAASLAQRLEWVAKYSPLIVR